MVKVRVEVEYLDEEEAKFAREVLAVVNRFENVYRKGDRVYIVYNVEKLANNHETLEMFLEKTSAYGYSIESVKVLDLKNLNHIIDVYEENPCANCINCIECHKPLKYIIEVSEWVDTMVADAIIQKVAEKLGLQEYLVESMDSANYIEIQESEAFDAVITAIEQIIFNVRGWDDDKADLVAEKLKKCGVRKIGVSRSYPEFQSGDVKYHEKLGVYRIYSGNTSVKARFSGITLYVYSAIEIDEDASVGCMLKALVEEVLPEL